MLNRAISDDLVAIGDEMLNFDRSAFAHENFLRAGKHAVDVNTGFFVNLFTDQCLDLPMPASSMWGDSFGSFDLTRIGVIFLTDPTGETT